MIELSSQEENIKALCEVRCVVPLTLANFAHLPLRTSRGILAAWFAMYVAAKYVWKTRGNEKGEVNRVSIYSSIFFVSLFSPRLHSHLQLGKICQRNASEPHCCPEKPTTFSPSFSLILRDSSVFWDSLCR